MASSTQKVSFHTYIPGSLYLASTRTSCTVEQCLKSSFLLVLINEDMEKLIERLVTTSRLFPCRDMRIKTHTCSDLENRWIRGVLCSWFHFHPIPYLKLTCISAKSTMKQNTYEKRIINNETKNLWKKWKKKRDGSKSTDYFFFFLNPLLF